MNLYFIEIADQDPTNLSNWFEDSSGNTPASGPPTSGDDCYIQSGTCSSDSFAYNSLTVNGGASLLINNGTVTYNYGTVTTNNGTITNHIYGAIITHQNGTLRIGTVTGGNGNISANETTNLSSQTAGTNVTLPSSALNWW